MRLGTFSLFTFLLCSVFFVLGESVPKEQDVSSVVELTDSNFYQLLTPKSEWVIAFTAKWCAACKSFKSDYESLGKYFNVNDPSIMIARIDIDENPALANQFLVTYLPTLYHLKNTEIRTLSELPRNVESMKSFLLEKKWKDIEPASGFLAPFAPFSRSTFIIMNNVYSLAKYVRSLPTATVLMLPGILIGIGLYYIFKSSPASPGAQSDKKEN